MQISNGSNANIFGQDAFNLAFAEVYFITPYGHLYSLATLLLAPRFAFRGALILHGTDSILLRPEASIGDFHPENWPQLMFVHFQTILCKPY